MCVKILKWNIFTRLFSKNLNILALWKINKSFTSLKEFYLSWKAFALEWVQPSSFATAESMCVYAVFVGCICGGPHLNCMGFAYNPLGPQFRELSVNYAHALCQKTNLARPVFTGAFAIFYVGLPISRSNSFKPSQQHIAAGCTVGHVGHNRRCYRPS